MRELPKSGEWKRKTWSNGIGEYPSEAGAPSIVTIDPSTWELELIGTPLQLMERNAMAGLVLTGLSSMQFGGICALGVVQSPKMRRAALVVLAIAWPTTHAGIAIPLSFAQPEVRLVFNLSIQLPPTFAWCTCVPGSFCRAIRRDVLPQTRQDAASTWARNTD